MSMFVLGIDLGKNVCSLVGFDETGAVVLRRRLRRDGVADFVGRMEPCIVAMEACCGAHHLGRVLGASGHTIRLMSPEYVRPYVKANKNDDHDAEAIAEAATRPTMRFVPVKSEAQSDIQALHRARSRLVAERTALINHLRALLLERGIVVAQGRRKLEDVLGVFADEDDSRLSSRMRLLIEDLRAEWRSLDERIAAFDAEFVRMARDDEAARRLHQALGFKFRTPGILLRNFVAFAEHRGEHVITTATVHEWALQAPSPEQRRNRLLTVRRFALSLHAEDPRHEVPSADLFGRASRKRRTPYIYSPVEIRRLIDAALRLGPDDSIRSITYATMFGLIAATGMRVSEAIDIRLPDVTDDGLIIAQTKFKKSRLLPLHTTTRRALDRYLEHRVPAVLDQALRVHAIPMKKIDEALVASLSRTEVQALLNAPDRRTLSGVRDRAMLHLALAGGLRVSELVGLTLDQFDGRSPASIHIIGKGRRERVLPLWQETAAAIRAWIAVRPKNGDTALFLNNAGRMMTRSGFEYIFEKHAAAASVAPTLATKSISPHVLRHSCAMHMLQATRDIRKVALWLGHATLQSTEIYLRAEKLEMLDALAPLGIKPGKFRPPDKLIAMLATR